MMPFEDHRNPWQSHYPTAALQNGSIEQKSLYKAMLAHAAFNLAHMVDGKEKMFGLATRYYTSAIEGLRHQVAEKQQDYGRFLAAVMTLMFVEVSIPQLGCSHDHGELIPPRSTVVAPRSGDTTSTVHGHS